MIKLSSPHLIQLVLQALHLGQVLVGFLVVDDLGSLLNSRVGSFVLLVLLLGNVLVGFLRLQLRCR